MTLDSIIEQSYKDYEIIVSDDKSETNYKDKVEAYFHEKKFSNYQLLYHAENQGTVWNYLKALKAAKGEYVKPISPGDMLYGNDALKKIADFVDKNSCIFGFGKMYSYKKESGLNGSYHAFYAPLDLRPYYTNNIKKIGKNIVLYADFISGAGMFARRQNAIEELENIAGVVRYCEDFIQIQLILKGISFSILDEPIILYEDSQGISTNQNKKDGKSKVQIDYENYITLLNGKYTDRLLKKRYRLNRYNEIRNPLKKIICKVVTAPGLYWFGIKYKRL